jgi:hypothetical protein
VNSSEYCTVRNLAICIGHCQDSEILKNVMGWVGSLDKRLGMENGFYGKHLVK